MTDDERDTMRRVYNECSEGAGVPEVLVTTGENINVMLGETVCEPTRIYVVTPDGIDEVSA